MMGTEQNFNGEIKFIDGTVLEFMLGETDLEKIMFVNPTTIQFKNATFRINPKNIIYVKKFIELKKK